MPRFKKGREYLILFMDPRQDQYTWYQGPGVYVRKHHDDFGEKEPHYVFLLPDESKCVFPLSAVINLQTQKQE